MLQHHLLLVKYKSKLQWGITSHQSEWPSSKNLQTIHARESVEKREPSYIVGGNVNWYNHYGGQYGGSFSTQSQRKAMPKNVHTTTQLYSSHMLAKKCSKFSRPGFNSTWTVNFHIFKLDLEKAEEPLIKLPTFVGSSKKQESSRKTSTSALLNMPKPLTVWITKNYGKFWKRWEYQTTLPPEKSEWRSRSNS